MRLEITAETLRRLREAEDDPRQICELLQLSAAEIDLLASRLRLSEEEKQAVAELRAVAYEPRRVEGPLNVIDVASDGLSDQEYLEKLTQAARPSLDQGFGIVGFEWERIRGVAHLVRQYRLGIPKRLDELYQSLSSIELVLRFPTFRARSCITAGELVTQQQFFQSACVELILRRFGMADAIWITAADAYGRGMGFHAGWSRIGWATPDEKRVWEQHAANLSLELQLRSDLQMSRLPVREQRRRVAPESRSRLAALLDAVAEEKSLQSAFGRTTRPESRRRQDVTPDELLSDEALSVLTARERAVLAQAQLGRSDASIAASLALARSTVRALLAKAEGKLRNVSGIRSRQLHKEDGRARK